jgi:hypothetical protein
MAATSWSRRSYEAGVLLVPLDPQARAALNGQPAAALDGITVTPPELTGSPDGRLEQAARRADIVVLLVFDLAAVDPAVVVRLDSAAHRAGASVGAVVVSPDRRWSDPAAQRGAVTLREAADTVLVLGDLGLAMAFVQVLRGGSAPDTAAAVVA